MKNHCLILLLFLASVSLYAQSNEQRVAYFNKNWQRLPDEEGAAYYRTMVPSRGIFVIRDYTASGTLQMEAECSEYTPKLIYHGKMKRFFDNGNVSEEGNYKNGDLDSEMIYYYETGTPKERREYTGEKILHKQYYTEDGKELLVNGRGVLTETGENGEPIYTLVKNYEYFSCYKLTAAKDTVFLILEQMAEYPGGLTQLGQDMGKSFKYPKSARKAGIEGTVYLNFVINEAGQVEDIKIESGIGGGCDEEAVRVISELKPWKPAISRGKVVKSRFRLPFKFRLTG